MEFKMKSFSRKVKKYSVIPFLLVLTACGGGGGSDSTVSTISASPGGIWEGQITSSSTGESQPSTGFVTESGELRFLTEDSVQVTGSMFIDGTTFSANLVSFAPFGSIFLLNHLNIISETANGNIIEKNSFSGSVYYSGEATSNFSFNYSQAYELGSSLSSISGMYFKQKSGVSETFEVDSSGNITGVDSLGCQYLGQITLLDTNYNLYRVNVSVTNCGELNDQYSGLAALLNNELAVSVSGAKYVIVTVIPKI